MRYELHVAHHEQQVARHEAAQPRNPFSLNAVQHMCREWPMGIEGWIVPLTPNRHAPPAIFAATDCG